MISSQNNARKYCIKGHEQVLFIWQVVLETPMTKWQEKLSKLLWQIVTLATGLFCTKSARMSTCTFSVPSWRNYSMTWNQNLETSKRRLHCQIINLLRRLKKIRRVESFCFLYRNVRSKIWMFSQAALPSSYGIISSPRFRIDVFIRKAGRELEHRL